jgi:hypothetical protein
VLKFFDWAYKNGGKEANALDYATCRKAWLSKFALHGKPT